MYRGVGRRAPVVTLPHRSGLQHGLSARSLGGGGGQTPEEGGGRGAVACGGEACTKQWCDRPRDPKTSAPFLVLPPLSKLL